MCRKDARVGGTVLADHIHSIVEPGNPAAVRIADARNAEDGWLVDGHTSNADPFLHNL